DVAVSGDIVHAAGIISIGASSNAGLTATGTLTLLGSAVLDGSGVASLVTIAGDTSITSASAYFRMGSGTWTFGGSWSNSTTSTNWLAATGVVIFDSSSSQTLTFANLAGDEFHDVTFQSAAGSGTIVFSMAATGLRWSGLLAIQDSVGSTTTLATSNLSLTGGSLAVGNSGTLIASTSRVAVVNVTMTGGASGTLTLTRGSWIVSGQWDTSGTGSTFARGTSTVTMSGTSATVATLDANNGLTNLAISGTITHATATTWTIAIGRSQSPATLIIAGSVTMASPLTVSSLTITAGGLAKGPHALTVNGNLTLDGGYLTSTSGSASIAGSVNVSSASSYI